MKKYISLLVILISNLIYSQDLKPLGVYDNLISHNYYSLSYSEEHKQAEWVYYKLNLTYFNTEYNQEICGINLKKKV